MAGTLRRRAVHLHNQVKVVDRFFAYQFSTVYKMWSNRTSASWFLILVVLLPNFSMIIKKSAAEVSNTT